MKQEKYNRYIRRLMARLQKLQNENGSWADNNFINSLVAYSLSEINAAVKIPTMEKMLSSTVDYILSQKSLTWSWNYYPNEKYKHSRTKYPDDLDDTFCSLIAIHKIRPEIITPRILEYTDKILAGSATKTGGPYSTWIGVSSKNALWDDIDPVVNANFTAFYSMIKTEANNKTRTKIAGITKYIDDSLSEKNIPSNYYDNSLLAYYFIARNYRGFKRNALIGKILENLDRAKASGGKNVGLFAEIALATCALSRLHAPFETIGRLVEILQKQIISTKAINEATTEKTPLYVEKIIAGKKYHAYSDAFTLAVCGEALSLYQKEASLLEKIYSAAQQRCKIAPNPLRSQALGMLEKMFRSGALKDILLLPYRISNSTNIDYGLISLYGWIAYTLYDRIIDKKETPQLLPVANLFHREMIVECDKCIDEKYPELFHVFQKILDTIDNAQANEALKNRTQIPSKRQIVDKSIGLILPSLLALIHDGMSAHGPEMKRFVRLFRDYIFVRQMSDDIRDWREDTKNGIVTRVTGKIGKNKKWRIISAREIITCYTAAHNEIDQMRASPTELFLVSLIGEYAMIAKQFLKNNPE